MFKLFTGFLAGLFVGYLLGVVLPIGFFLIVGMIVIVPMVLLFIAFHLGVQDFQGY